jgi:hypothetical protein
LLQFANPGQYYPEGVREALWDRRRLRVGLLEFLFVFSSHATLTIPANGISALTTERTSTSPLGLPS